MSEDDVLSSFMKKQTQKGDASDGEGRSGKSGDKNSTKSDGIEKSEEEKELDDARKESKALAAKMSAIAPELAKQKLKRMLVFYGIGAFFLLIILYAHSRNPMWLSNLFNKMFNSIFF